MSLTGGGGGASSACDAFATEVVSVTFGPGQSFGQDAMPAIVLGPPHGGGVASGSLDVVSLGDGGEVTLAFGDTAIVDGPGADFVVFENPFQPLGDPDLVFAELGTVAVSADGVTFVAFPCSADDTAPPPYGSCAGWHPVLLDGDAGPVDPETSGGDPFDLADVGLAEARFVRVVDRPDLASVLDLDAVGIVHPSCAP
ncbi:MAG: hypothetical protein HY908_09150 [Myxococcales bacterium]|nr:hypothetical protein [Myxococcales bacterium]